MQVTMGTTQICHSEIALIPFAVTMTLFIRIEITGPKVPASNGRKASVPWWNAGKEKNRNQKREYATSATVTELKTTNLYCQV